MRSIPRIFDLFAIYEMLNSLDAENLLVVIAEQNSGVEGFLIR